MLFQTIQFSVNTVWISKTVPFQTFQFSIQKQFYLKQFSLALVCILNARTVLFQVIQFSISTQFSSIWPIDRTLSDATTLGHSGPGSMAIKGYSAFPKAPVLLVLYSHTYTYANSQIQMQYTGGLCCSGMNGLLTSDFRFFDTRRKTQFLLC